MAKRCTPWEEVWARYETEDCTYRQLAEEYGVAYLNSDFKKKNGYKRSVELSEQYGMYRQYYCGCVFSKRERDAQIAAKAAAQGI